MFLYEPQRVAWVGDVLFQGSIGRTDFPRGNHDDLVAMLFIIFDIEVVFLYPWAAKFLQLELFALIEMAVFVGILTVGLAYIWVKGDLDWVKKLIERPGEADASAASAPASNEAEEVPTT